MLTEHDPQIVQMGQDRNSPSLVSPFLVSSAMICWLARQAIRVEILEYKLQCEQDLARPHLFAHFGYLPTQSDSPRYGVRISRSALALSLSDSQLVDGLSEEVGKPLH